MKKLLILGAIALFGASLALAHGNGYGRGYYGMGPGMMGQGYGQSYGSGNCMGYNYHGNSGQQLGEKDAEEAVKNIIAKQFHGMKVQEVKNFQMPMGTMYEVEVIDTNNNKFDFHVNPWGNVMGPFTDNFGENE